jgi:hypothetical protein
MAQEFTINSSAIESKINQLLPSQGGFGAGVDFSASTMVIPIVDLTESAEGSGLRQDLQSAFSHVNITRSSINNATSTFITTTGYWRITGTSSISSNTGTIQNKISINDGTTDKVCYQHTLAASATSTGVCVAPFDFIVKVSAGDSVKGESDNGNCFLSVVARQIATISGDLVDP